MEWRYTACGDIFDFLQKKDGFFCGEKFSTCFFKTKSENFMKFDIPLFAPRRRARNGDSAIREKKRAYHLTFRRRVLIIIK